ncbi:ABC transporter permease [Paenibacillus soyae]|uniref:ABC transporter permease n=1 Tax=Paenibacillus soyae TaxID=2969249 RepID=A0A9X2MWG6_9BACL|nr:ABC transporter permease [Paenibacillus soyae]MCR2807153.1 ABC transporter permease [Paenibacillus soyae]
MRHLIKLELKKGKLFSYIGGSLLAYGILAGFLMLIYMVEGPSQEEEVFRDYGEMLLLIDTLVRATFIIYASALISRSIIGEFRDKTMALLFTYPVSRKKIIFAKLIIVFVWTFANIMIANALIGGLFLAVNSVTGYVDDTVTTTILLQHGAHVLTHGIAAAGMSLLPLAVGMRKKSGTATVISSIFIVMIVCSNNMGFSLSSIIAIPLSLGALGILLTYLSFRNIDRVDVV